MCIIIDMQYPIIIKSITPAYEGEDKPQPFGRLLIGIKFHDCLLFQEQKRYIIVKAAYTR